MKVGTAREVPGDSGECLGEEIFQERRVYLKTTLTSTVALQVPQLVVELSYSSREALIKSIVSLSSSKVSLCNDN